MGQSITVGTDPEVFVTEGDNIVSAIGRIGGSKDNPRPVKLGAVQEDNVLAEFNITPAKSSDEFIHNIRGVMKELGGIVAPLQLSPISSHEFTKDVLEAAGPKALEFGCDPDYNAWMMDVNDSPDAQTTLRTAGGHVHVGWSVEDEDLDPFKGAIMMDFYLGLPSVILDHDVRRRSLYGKAGACRPKLVSRGDPYNGVEYRSLSNFWLKDDNLIKWVFDNTVAAIENIGSFYDLINEYDGEVIQDVINSSNKDKAEQIIKEIGIYVPEV